jgi:hypothetical protein
MGAAIASIEIGKAPRRFRKLKLAIEPMFKVSLFSSERRKFICLFKFALPF